ncbi:hypothetical protein N7512_010238 [Penicillium capsulatum]|nr:hypothetical protein N7512_010238 [Penicillium capsulatum]
MMEETFQIHPLGWENDPEEERMKVAMSNYLPGLCYNIYVLYFRLNEAERTPAVEVLKAGLARTLSQARQLCGRVEKDAEGGHSFVKQKDSTVRLDVQWLDAQDDCCPSLDDLENANFRISALGPPERWIIPEMKFGERPECHMDNSPLICAFKASLVPGGLVFAMHHHHCANDLLGWAGFTHQLAENCYAIRNGTPFPHWDMACLDLGRFSRPVVPKEMEVDGPGAPPLRPNPPPAEALLFCLSKDKAAELKKLCHPLDGSWISTHDAFSAFIWRTLTRVRSPVYSPDPSAPLMWMGPVNLRPRLNPPKVPERLQQNVTSAAISTRSEVPAPTAAEVLSEWPLSRLAAYIRMLTNAVSEESVGFRVGSLPPMSVFQTDHRNANVTSADFGFGTPLRYRQLMDAPVDLVLVYPPRKSDGGLEFLITIERDLTQVLLEDPEWNSYFEYLGVDTVDAGEGDQL